MKGFFMTQSIKTGFSLLELMIYIAIVAILLAVAVPNFFSYIEKARKSTTESNLHMLEEAIIMYHVHIGQYPQRLSDLIKRPSDDRVAKKWEGPYLKAKEIPLDGWSNKFEYKLTPQNPDHKYELYSYGPNGKGSQSSEWIRI